MFQYKPKTPVSIIVPVFNEQVSLAQTISDIKKYVPDVEIIIVDDCSTDNSFEIAKKTGEKVIKHENNNGYGGALKTGLREAKNDVVGIIDADGSYLPSDIPKLLDFVDDYDMVVGVRPKQKIPFIRRPAKWFLIKLANYLCQYKIPDINSGLRFFKKPIAQKFLHILPSGFSFTTTITLAMLSEGYKVKYLPISYLKRQGKSKIKPIKDTLNFIQLIIRTVLYFNPLRVFLPVSLFLGFLGLITFGYDLFILKNITDKTVVFINTAILIGAIGLLADLINKKMNF